MKGSHSEGQKRGISLLVGGSFVVERQSEIWDGFIRKCSAAHELGGQQ